MDYGLIWLGAQEAPAQGLSGMLVPMMVVFLIFYFMVIRPQQRKEKERSKMLDEVRKGDKVVFAGGLMGMVTNVKKVDGLAEPVLTIKIADSVKVEATRSAVIKTLSKGEEESGEGK